jgi:hypothetical protein
VFDKNALCVVDLLIKMHELFTISEL